MERLQLNETFSGDVTFTDQDVLCESGDYASVIDGTNIIGMVEGQFFQPDGMSRNKRWYSRKLWDKVLASADVRNRLLNRTMYGEIGHSDGPVTDMTLRDGNVSHIIADLWIDDKGRGMGRAYIIDTPKGRLLKTYLGAKSKLKVSTRGEGVYLDGETHDGCPVIDPDTYELQTVDFVLNPGFLETSAKLTTKAEDFTPEIKQVNETTSKTTREGEKSMDMDKYVTKLEEKIAALEAKNESLGEELKSKDKELLKYQYEESAEVQKITEELAPFKKIGVSAKTLSETLKKSQNSLQKANETNAKLTEELEASKAKVQAYVDKCGSMEQVEEALAMSEKALNTLAEYQKLGTVAEIQELMTKAEALAPKLEQLSTLTEYRELGSVEDIKSLMEKSESALEKLKDLSVLEDYRKLGSIEEIQNLSQKCESMIPRLKQLSSLKEYRELGSVEEIKGLMEVCEKALPKLAELSVLEDYKKLGSIEDIKELSKKCEAMLPKLAELKDARKLAENVEKKVMPKLREMKELEATTKEAKKLIKEYLETVGTMNEAKALVESRKETIKRVNVKEALEVSKQFNCTIESAAKLLKEYGKDEAVKMLESASQKTEEVKPVEKLAESTDLVEEAQEMDVVNAEAEKADEKTAYSFLKTGMIVNGFNDDALGKRTINIENLDKLEGNKVAGEQDAKDLLKSYLNSAKAEVEKAPEVEAEKTPEKAEKEADKILEK